MAYAYIPSLLSKSCSRASHLFQSRSSPIRLFCAANAASPLPPARLPLSYQVVPALLPLPTDLHRPIQTASRCTALQILSPSIFILIYLFVILFRFSFPFVLHFFFFPFMLRGVAPYVHPESSSIFFDSSESVLQLVRNNRYPLSSSFLTKMSETSWHPNFFWYFTLTPRG